MEYDFLVCPGCDGKRFLVRTEKDTAYTAYCCDCLRRIELEAPRLPWIADETTYRRMLERLDAATEGPMAERDRDFVLNLGVLLAAYEHKAATRGEIPLK